MISAEDRERLAHAIRDAEAGTAGEIVVVLAGEASGYRTVPILWALLCALATPWPLIWITTLGPSRIFLVQLAVALILSVVLSLPKRHEFMARGLTRTRDRTGVLIYVAAAEHYAEILADTGIADRVDQEVWRAAIAELIDAIKAGRAGDGLLAVVHRVGAILAEHAPPHADDADELPNKVILI